MRKLVWFVGVVAVACWLGSDRTHAQRGTQPILVVLNSTPATPFGAYLPEMLRAEGISSFSVANLAAVNASTLSGVPLVVLAETALTPGQADMFTGYVNAGGRLVAMRPDSRLNGVLGIGDGTGSTANGYTLIDQAGVGAGLQGQTLPFKGDARHFALAGATAVAGLYYSRSATDGWPAVVRYGRTAAWAFDLARSTAYTRQGDPADAGLERDGLPPIRTTDVFYQRIDLERVGVPHADVHMRLFSRMITTLLADTLPLPRLWYFPGNARTVLVTTGDSHVSDVASYQALLGAVEAVGARMTLYLNRFLSLSGSPAATWEASGHDLSVHPVFTEDGQSGNFQQGYATVFDWFGFNLPPPVTPGPTVRHHTLEWQGWVGPVSVMSGRGIRMDLSYSAFGPTMHLVPGVREAQAHGYLTGSGLPMRFIDVNGGVVAGGSCPPCPPNGGVYQQVTSLADEQLVADMYSEVLPVDAALAVSRRLIDDSQTGGYSAIATQFHVDYYQRPEVKPWVDGTLAYAASQQVPMLNAERWLAFVEARAATTTSGLVWNPVTGQLTFAVTVPAGAPAQPLLMPQTFAGRVLARVAVDGQTVAPLALTVNGAPMQVVAVAPSGGGAARQVMVRYSLGGSLPVVSIADGSAPEGNSGTVARSLTVSLSAVTDTDVAVRYTTSNGTASAGSDYRPVTDGVVLVPAGATSAPAPLGVIGDGDYEPDETVLVTLSNQIGATLGDGAATFLIANDEPDVAFVDVYNTPYLTPLVVAAGQGVLANDHAHGRPGLRAVLISPTTHGTLALAADGSLTYIPPARWAGVDSFTYRADTDAGLGNVVTVSINVSHPTTVQPPDGLRVAAMNGNRIMFRWNAPPIGPAPTGYQLEGGVAAGQPIVALPTGLAAPIVDIAAPSGSFYVRIRTLGAGGPSAPSNEILAHIGVPVAPSLPTGLQATSVGNAVHLAWTPTFEGGAPGGFVLDVGGTLAAAVPLPDLERVSFAGAPSGAFTLSLRAVNAGGSSAPSAPVPLAVPGACAGPPGPPTNLLAYLNAGTTFVIWDPPASGSPPTSYLVTVPGIGALPLAQRTISGPLPAGTWSISVQAIGPCGASAPVGQTHVVP
jgi:Calx-beta domain/Bacterial Ig domain